MAAGRDLQSLVLDHMKLGQVGGGQLSESDRGGIIQDGAHDGQQSFSRETQIQSSCRAFMPLRALEYRSTQSRA